jgi:hypothetical protein
MEYFSDYKGREDEIISLFNVTFSASDGPDEGKANGALVKTYLKRQRIKTCWFLWLARERSLLVPLFSHA